MDICHLKKCRIGDKAPKVQRQSRAPRRQCERWFWILCRIYGTRIISISNDCSKSHGYHIQTATVRRTSSGCSICWNPGNNGTCSKIVEKSQIGMSRHLDSSTTTQMAKIMVQYGRPSRSSWTKSVWSFWQDCYGKGNLRKSYWGTVGRRFPIENACSLTEKKGQFLSVYVDDINLAGKKHIVKSDVESTQQRSRLGRTNIFSWSCIPGMHSKNNVK